MSDADVPGCMALKEAAGWNQTEDDWILFLRVSAELCFVAVSGDGMIAGSVTIADYGGGLGWLGMMLVHPELRRRGIGTRLMKTALSAATGRITGLDATDLGVPLYKSLGFEAGWALDRLVTNSATPTGCGDHRCRPVQAVDIPRVAEFDAQAFGCRRVPLLSDLQKRAPGLAWMLGDAEGVASCAGRPGTQRWQIGPVAADRVADAQSVVSAALDGLEGAPVLMDVPRHQPQFREWLLSAGFAVERSFTRMTIGGRLGGDRNRLFAIAGPEFG